MHAAIARSSSASGVNGKLVALDEIAPGVPYAWGRRGSGGVFISSRRAGSGARHRYLGSQDLNKGGSFMKRRIVWLSAVFVLFPVFASQAQEVTSREIPFSLQTSLPPGTTQEIVVELWDSTSGGNLLFDEPYTGSNALNVDGAGGISFTFGSLHQPTGLNPDDFPSRSSRYFG